MDKERIEGEIYVLPTSVQKQSPEEYFDLRSRMKKNYGSGMFRIFIT
jgi:hypothetical protein